MILLTGVTGKTGKVVAEIMQDKSFPVRALVRNINKATFLKETNIELFEGSFEDANSIKTALNGVKKAFLLPANSENQLKQEIQFIDLAKDEGVEHIVKLSALGADANSDNNILKWHGLAEKYLEDSGIIYTRLQPNFFMQNFIMNSSQTIRDENAFYLPMKNGRCGLVDARDIASVAVETLITGGHENKTYQITGPESLDFSTMAERFSRILDKQIVYTDISPESFKEELLEYGVPEILSEAVKDLYVKLSKGKLDIVTDHVFEITNKNPISFDKFVSDHKHLFTN
ncbi:MAG: SDR family oxidoreductase [Candidatus Dadabacteria bacterium]|nr:SDR family oxidoreductase [Candidatus Dadabacteria bacterium]